MSTFYSNMASVASTLIDQFGRSMTLVKDDRTSADSSKPWRGNAASGDVSLIVKGAMTEFEDNEVDGDLIRRGDLACWVGAVSGQDLSTFDFVLDEGSRYRIIDVETIRPGPTTVAYKLQLRV